MQFPMDPGWWNRLTRELLGGLKRKESSHCVILKDQECSIFLMRLLDVITLWLVSYMYFMMPPEEDESDKLK